MFIKTNNDITRFLALRSDFVEMGAGLAIQSEKSSLGMKKAWQLKSNHVQYFNFFDNFLE